MSPVAVDSAKSAISALERARDAGTPFALIVLDAMMPEMDGFDLAEALKSRPDLAGPAIVMLSSAGQRAAPDRCEQLGLSAYLTKPVRQSALLETILKVLNMPAPTGAATALTDEAIPAGPPQPLQILLAEDHPVNQRLAVRLLERHGHRTVVASTGTDALALLSDGQFDLVLMDVQMPGMDGFEVTAAIRDREKGTGRHIPIIAMTAHAMKGDRERCLASGMDSYLSKPLQARELYTEIGKVKPYLGLQSAPSTATDQRISTFDLSAALEQLEGDMDLLQEMIELFRESEPEMLAALELAVKEENVQDIARGAHRLRGCVASFGGRRASEAARVLELAADTGDLEATANVWKVVQAEMELLHWSLDAVPELRSKS